MHPRTPLLTTLPLLLLPFSTAQNIQGHSNIQENPLFSCLELECPVDSATPQTFCRLYNQTLLSVGMTQAEAEAVAPGANFTWTVGNNNHYHVNASVPSMMNVERVYYMGSQFEVPEDTHGCAFYMTKAEYNENIFPPPPVNTTAQSFFPETDPSFCRTTYLAGNNPDIPGGCTKALNEIFQVAVTKVANNQNNETATDFSADTCQQIADSVLNSLATEPKASQAGCSIATAGPDAAVIRGVPITGPNAEEPIPTADNASWACYPTLPKTNELTRVFSYNITVVQTDPGQAEAAMNGETPVWTGYWKRNGSAVNWQDVFVDMVCLRPVNMNSKQAEMMNNGSGSGDEGAGVSMIDRSQIWTTIGVAMVVAAAAVLI